MIVLNARVGKCAGSRRETSLRKCRHFDRAVSHDPDMLEYEASMLGECTGMPTMEGSGRDKHNTERACTAGNL